MRPTVEAFWFLALAVGFGWQAHSHLGHAGEEAVGIVLAGIALACLVVGGVGLFPG